jgi:hypothetical protein
MAQQRVGSDRVFTLVGLLATLQGPHRPGPRSRMLVRVRFPPIADISRHAIQPILMDVLTFEAIVLGY